MCTRANSGGEQEREREIGKETNEDRIDFHSVSSDVYDACSLFHIVCVQNLCVTQLEIVFSLCFPTWYFFAVVATVVARIDVHKCVCVCAVLLVVFMAVRAGGTRGKHITYNRKATLSKRSIEMKENRTWHQHHHKYSHGKRPSDRENEKNYIYFFCIK